MPRPPAGRRGREFAWPIAQHPAASWRPHSTARCHPTKPFYVPLHGTPSRFRSDSERAVVAELATERAPHGVMRPSDIGQRKASIELLRLPREHFEVALTARLLFALPCERRRPAIRALLALEAAVEPAEVPTSDHLSRLAAVAMIGRRWERHTRRVRLERRMRQRSQLGGRAGLSRTTGSLQSPTDGAARRRRHGREHRLHCRLRRCGSGVRVPGSSGLVGSAAVAACRHVRRPNANECVGTRTAERHDLGER